MSDIAEPAYLSGLGSEQVRALTELNSAGLDALRRYLAVGEAVAFLGAGVSAPLYPLWTGVVGDLVDVACGRGLGERTAATIRAVAGQRPDTAVELVRRHLGVTQYQAALREVFRARRDGDSGRTWTKTHELVCRCPFRAIVTTNYDPGIVDARMRVRPRASGTGFASWTDELGLDRWDTGDVFGDAELPVLFAHGHHNQPEAIVLATTEYRRAYAGKLSRVLAGLIRRGHLVWIGFSFADQRITAILREVAEHAGSAIDPGAEVRHVAVMGWDPAGGMDPQTLRAMAEIEYGADLVLYPTPGSDHSALQALLSEFTAPGYPPAPALAESPPTAHRRVPAPVAGGSRGAAGVPVLWMPPAEPVPHFTGRVEELTRLARWAEDPVVRLIGVTAWGGAGKTALVTEWLERRGGAAARPGVRGVFGWSFYADASAENWATALLDWAVQNLGVAVVGRARPGAAALVLLEAVPLVLVLDGLEVAQEGPEGVEFGRLLDGTLREVLTGACQVQHQGLVVLTSRFPFADVEGFDGDTARMLDVPPFTPAEGAALLAATGGGWLPDEERRKLVAEVDGHALALAALGAVLANRPPTADLAGLRAELTATAGTNTRVAKVLNFYATRLAEPDRYLVAAVALFAHPVTPAVILVVAGHEAFGGRLTEWSVGMVEAAARDRLAGLLSWHPDGTLTAHPLVRDAFRPLALNAAEVAADTTLTSLPAGKITSREDGLRVVEAIELLIAADQWEAADDLYGNRTDGGQVWLNLPAARLGQRTASAFVATPDRRHACADRLGQRRLGFYLSTVGLFASYGGDLMTAREFLNASVAHDRDADDALNLAIALQNLTECLGHLGDIDAALKAAKQATATADRTDDRTEIKKRTSFLGWVLTLAGDTPAAEEQFRTADRMQRADEDNHLYSILGDQWGEFLTRTGRTGPARTLTDRNRAMNVRHGWSAGVARCDRLLGSLDLAAGDPGAAREKVAAAAAVFRDGDFLVMLAETLPVLGECARAAGDLDAADLHVAEALTVAGPRGLVPAQTAALTVRARIHADRVAAGNPATLERGRDAADAAHRLAVRHRLPWHELDALDANTRLDTVASSNNGWADRAAVLRARLIPASLDPDPLATIERQIAVERTTAAGEVGP
jgi:tetratricopeptide (TPR) repeat protein